MIHVFIKDYQLFCIPLVVGICIQVIKIIIDQIQGKHVVSFTDLWTAGGFPSVHSGISSSIVTIMALQYGCDSPFFAISLCFSFLFWYDAANVRYQAGQHAQYLNYFYRLFHELEKIGIHEKHLLKLKERLGHTTMEVMGGIVAGALTTFILYSLVNG